MQRRHKRYRSIRPGLNNQPTTVALGANGYRGLISMRWRTFLKASATGLPGRHVGRAGSSVNFNANDHGKCLHAYVVARRALRVFFNRRWALS